MKEPIMIGTDPEFILMLNGHLRDASNYSFFASTKRYSKIGCDGAATPVEIRTTPVPINRVGNMMADINTTFSLT